MELEKNEAAGGSRLRKRDLLLLWMDVCIRTRRGEKKKKDYGLRISEISRDSCSLEGETHDRKSSRSSFVSTQMEIYVYCASMIYICFAYLLPDLWLKKTKK